MRLTPRHRSFRSGDAYVKPSSEADATAVLAMSGRELGARVVRVRKARPGEADWAATNFAHPPNGDYAGAVRMRGVPHDADEVRFCFLIAGLGAAGCADGSAIREPAHSHPPP